MRRSGRAGGAGPGLPPAELARALARLPDLGTMALRAEWERLHRRPPLPDLTRDLLLRGVAHRLQEAALGGLSPAALGRVEALAAPGIPARKRGGRGGRLKPGTVLVRDWQGEAHSVTVREGGFEYRGRLRRSLSLVAREITGARWSGPRFFGLLRGARPAAAAGRGTADAG